MLKVIVQTEKMAQTIATGLNSVEECFSFIREFATELCWKIVEEDRHFRFAIGQFGLKTIVFRVENE